MRGVFVAVLAIGCGSNQPPPPAPPPPVQPAPPAGDAVGPSDPPSGGFAQPPPGGSAAPASLPLTGPECTSGCPPAPMYPTQTCPDRIHIGGRGPCVRFASGCNWSRLDCPDQGSQLTCKPTDCSLPTPSEWLCPDRKTVARFSCVPAKTGRCGATYEGCPVAAQQPPPPKPPPPPPPTPCPDPLPSDRVLATWPIGQICQPGGGPAQPPRRYLKGLPDGTQIIEQLGRCLRVRQVQCNTKCLPPDTRIATPAGDVPVQSIRVGTMVWTQDLSGRRIAAPVISMSSPKTGSEHHVARLRLADGRVLVASPEHPVVGGRLEDLRVGDRYDGSAIVELALERYLGDRTYDVLPAGATGLYWADGVLVGSTLVVSRPFLAALFRRRAYGALRRASLGPDSLEWADGR